jgi:hypothetical protein
MRGFAADNQMSERMLSKRLNAGKGILGKEVTDEIL